MTHLLREFKLAIWQGAAEHTLLPSGPVANEPMPFLVVRYLSGQHDRIPVPSHTTAEVPDVLPLRRLAIAHLRAATAQDPAALVAVACELRKFERWGPAAYALTTARIIYLSRRASAEVRECDERIAEIVQRISASLPWFRLGDLPTVTLVRLTPRQLEVAQLVAAGLTNAEIAPHLGCSVRTVESHVAQARAKLGAANRKELVWRIRLLDTAEPAQPGPQLPAA